MNIWVNGCFDILHTGHLDLLEYAKHYNESKLFDRINSLIVGIDSDRRVKELKGKDRPINSQEDRKRFLNSLHFVERVYIFDTEEELRQLIKELEIDIMVVGEEYRDKEVIGSENAKHGVVYFPVDERSSTNIIEKIEKEIYTEMWERFKDDDDTISIAFNNYAVGKLRKL